MGYEIVIRRGTRERTPNTKKQDLTNEEGQENRGFVRTEEGRIQVPFIPSLRPFYELGYFTIDSIGLVIPRTHDIYLFSNVIVIFPVQKGGSGLFTFTNLQFTDLV